MTSNYESTRIERDSQTSIARWYVAYTASCREKRVVDHLASREIESFLPLYRSRRKWKNGCRVDLQRPLFPSYVFVRIAGVERIKVLEVPGILSIVSRGRVPEPLPDDIVTTLRANLDPWQAEPHPYLVIGERVTIRTGPFSGISGIVLRKKGRLRVVITLELIMRSMALEVNVEDLEPVLHGFPADRMPQANSLGCYS
jgi:transcription antitermination factor NusG